MRQRRSICTRHKIKLASQRRTFGHILRGLRYRARHIIHDLYRQRSSGRITIIVQHLNGHAVEQRSVRSRLRVHLIIQQGVLVNHLARVRIVAGDHQLVALRGHHLGIRDQHPILDHLYAINLHRLHTIRRADGEVARAFFRVQTMLAALAVQRLFVHSGVTTVYQRRQILDFRLVIRRHRRTTPITPTQRRQNQERQPPQRHRRHARAQRLPSLHPVGQHAHRIRAHRAFRNVRVHIAVLVRAYQQVVCTLAVANLAVVLVIVFDHQIGLVHIAAFKRNVQVLAHALGGDVFGAVPRCLVGEVVLHVAQRLDAHALATGSNAPFAPGNLHGLHRLAGVVDLQDDVLQAHDASLFPRQRLVFMGALRESCGGGSSYRATARSMTVR